MVATGRTSHIVRLQLLRPGHAQRNCYGVYHPPLVHFTRLPDANWERAEWQSAETLEVTHFSWADSGHRPGVCARVLYDERFLAIIFRVEDRYVRAVAQNFQDSVCSDSCVEFFVAPMPDSDGYFNFEVNCGGTLHSSFVEDWTRTPDGFERFTPLPESLGEQITIHHTAPRVIEPEHAAPLAWQLGLSVPFAVLREFAGDFDVSPGTRWRANFHKCGDETSHPHWATWSPVDTLNFHEPAYFGTIEFGGG